MAVARRTTGFSGAALATLMNEAAIVAARRNLKLISYAEIDFAIDRATVGRPRVRLPDIQLTCTSVYRLIYMSYMYFTISICTLLIYMYFSI